MRKAILLFLLGLSTIVQAQTLTIKDSITRQPLELVHVYSTNPPASDVTDARGRADLSGFESADSIRIELIGYQPVVVSYAQLKARDFELFLVETPILMNDVVVSAARWHQESKDVPTKITAIRPAQIALQNPQTAADLLGTSGEVFIQKSQLGGGSPMIRGFAANRVLIAVDGVRMNTAIFRSGNMQNVISLDPFATRRTEVIFGPGSVIYGSDALGGVMSFYTLKPKFSGNGAPLISGKAVSRSSSAAFEKTGHVDVHVGLKNWAFVTSATFTDFDHLHMGSHGPSEYLRPHFVRRINGRDTLITNGDPEEQVFTGYSQTNLMQKVRFQPDPNWDFSYALHYSTTSNIPRYDRLIELRKGLPRSAEWYYGPQKWLMHALNLEHRRSRGFFDAARLTLALQEFEESRHDRKFGENDLRHRTESIDVVSTNLDLEKSLGRRTHLFYGAEAVLNRVGSRAEIENIESGARRPTSTRYPDGATWDSFAGYLNARFDAGRRLTLQSGLRYNLVTLAAEFDTTFFPLPFTSTDLTTDAFTGSLGAVWRPHGSWQLNLHLSTGFRAPNIDDVGKVFDSEPGSVVVPNPDLRPEYAYNAELGVVHTVGHTARIDVTGYYTLLDDALVRRDFSLNGQDSVVYDGTLSQVQAIQNASRARVWGFQAGLELKLPHGFGVLSRFHFQEGEEDLEDGSSAPLRHAAPHFGTIHLTYTHDRIKADLYATYSTGFDFEDLAPEERSKPHLYAIDENGNPHSPGWYTLNLKLLYRLSDRLMLTTGVENITDQRYRPYSSGIAAPGRNFIAALRASF